MSSASPVERRRNAERVLRAAGTGALPSPVHTLLLRACLFEGDDAKDAWDELVESGVDCVELLKDGGHGLRRLTPLLYRNLADFESEVDPRLLTQCRMATMREELRSKAYLAIVRTAVDALTVAGVQPIILKGTALAEVTYGDPVLRHSHDLELLVSPADTARAKEALCAIGCPTEDPPRATGWIRLHHESGLPIVLRSRLLEHEHYPSGWDWFGPRAVTRTVAGRPVRVLSPADALHHACVHASYGLGRSSLQWAADACVLIAAEEFGDSRDRIDRDAFLDTVEHCRSAIPALVSLGYLEAELGAPVPPEVLGRLTVRVERAKAVERDVALRGAWRGKRRRLASAMHGLTWQDRTTVMRWMLFPSRGYMTLGRAASNGPALAYRYTARLFRNSLRLIGAAR